jgi:hypothetical protein
MKWKVQPHARRTSQRCSNHGMEEARGTVLSQWNKSSMSLLNERLLTKLRLKTRSCLVVCINCTGPFDISGRNKSKGLSRPAHQRGQIGDVSSSITSKMFWIRAKFTIRVQVQY